MTTISIKNKADLENVFGKKLSAVIVKSMRKSFMKKLPFCVYLTDTKPSFHLDDGGMLRAYAVDISSNEILSEKYCGSGDSAIMHTKEQLSEGQKVPGEVAVFFTESSPSSANHPWTLTVVSNTIIKQLSEK